MVEYTVTKHPYSEGWIVQFSGYRATPINIVRYGTQYFTSQKVALAYAHRIATEGK